MSRPALLAAAIAAALIASFAVVTVVLLSPVTSTRTGLEAPKADRPGPTWTSDRADDWLREPTPALPVRPGPGLIVIAPGGSTTVALEPVTVLE